MGADLIPREPKWFRVVFSQDPAANFKKGRGWETWEGKVKQKKRVLLPRKEHRSEDRRPEISKIMKRA